LSICWFAIFTIEIVGQADENQAVDARACHRPQESSCTPICFVPGSGGFGAPLGTIRCFVGPVCAVAAAGVYRSHLQLYAAQSRARQAVPATVVETRPSLPHNTRVDVLAMWEVGVGGSRTAELQGGHTGWVSTDRTAKVGDRIDVWVDNVGALTAPPKPPSQSGLDALGFGAGIWLVATTALFVAVGLVRSRLNRIRHVQWEREIKGFAPGGRSNRPH
jgi:hypothetical protein